MKWLFIFHYRLRKELETIQSEDPDVSFYERFQVQGIFTDMFDIAIVKTLLTN